MGRPERRGMGGMKSALNGIIKQIRKLAQNISDEVKQ